MKTLLAMVLVVVVVASAEAQTMYRYVDEKGEVHMTDDPNKVPKAKGGTGAAADDPRQPPRQMKDEDVLHTLPPGSPARQLKNENLLYSLPRGFKLDFESRQKDVLLNEAVPNGESVKNWTEMVTTVIYFGTKTLAPEQYQATMKDLWRKSCQDGGQHPVHTGKERGYQVSVFLQTCPLNPATGKPEYTWFKAMQGNDSFCIVQRAYRSVPSKEQAGQAVDFMRSVRVCDSRLPDRACPTIQSK